MVIVAGFVAPSASAASAMAGQSPSIGMMFIFVLLTYGGWSEAAYVSAEARDPARTIPRALLLSIAIITAVYLLANFAFLRAFGLAGLAASKAPAADLLRITTGEMAALLVSLAVMSAALSSMNPTILTGARTNFALGLDYYRFRWLGRWHDSAIAPRRALLVQGLISLALIVLGTLTRGGFRTMVEYTAPVFWLFITMTGIALFILRRRKEGRPRPYSVPLYPLTPILFCATSAYLLYASVTYTGIGAAFGVAVLCVGAVIMILSRPINAADRTDATVQETA
jgi:APA family basic amino acid/polyamine antiporter